MVHRGRSSAASAGRSVLPGLLVVLSVVCAVVYIFDFRSNTFTGIPGGRSNSGLALTAQEGLAAAGQEDLTAVQAFKYKDGDRTKYDGATRKMFLERLKHRRWAAQSKYPRIFGYVEKWDDTKGEGIIRDQEKTKNYLIVRDEIGRSFHNHATLQRCEMVEFFASDEIDDVYQLPLALNVSGPFGRHLKGCEEYRNRMLWTGQFPKRWSDNIDDFPDKRAGEWYINKRKNVGGDDE